MALVRHWTERLPEAVVSLALVAMTGVSVIDVAGRALFGAPLQGGYDVSELMTGLTVFAARPLATTAERHLAIGLLTDRLHGRARRGHRMVIVLVTAAALAFISWRRRVQALVSRGDAGWR